MGLFGHTRFFRQQLEQRWPRLYRVAYSWCHDPHLAGDLAQDTVIKALDKHHQLRNPDALNTWLFAILANCWRDHHRQHRDMLDIADVADEVLVQNEHPGSDRDDLNLVLSVRDAIAKLPIDYRQVITLVDLEEMSYVEVAEILDIPMGTVMSRVSRARRGLKQHLLDLRVEISDAPSGIRRIK